MRLPTPVRTPMLLRLWRLEHKGIWTDRWGIDYPVGNMRDDHLKNAMDNCARQAEIAWTHGNEQLARQNEAMWTVLHEEWEARDVREA